MHRYLRTAVVVLVALVLWAVITEADPSLTRRDASGPVTVIVTLTAPPAVGAPLTAKVVLDTHSAVLDGIVFDQAVVMRAADDREIAPRVETITGGGHHREAILVFPALAAAGPVRLVVKNVGGVAERTFVWDTAAR